MIMETSSTLVLFIILTISPAINARFLTSRCIDEDGNYTTDSTYHTNLKSLLPSLISNSSLAAGTQTGTGFFSSSRGDNPDKVYASFLCRADLELADCRRILNESTYNIMLYCPNRKTAAVWYEEGILRYSDVSMTGTVESWPQIVVFALQNVTSVDVDVFNDRVVALFESLRNRAVSGGGSPPNFAAGSMNVSGEVSVYGLVQCTPNLSGADCNDCVVEGVRYAEGHCYGKPYVAVGILSCSVIYSDQRFFDSAVDVRIQSLSSSPSPPPELPPSSQPTDDTNDAKDAKVTKRGRSHIIIVIIVLSLALVLVLVICTCLCLRFGTAKRIQTARFPSEVEEESDPDNAQSLQFDLRYIISATDNFSDANKVGRGGFGEVYKGRLSNGQYIAVKRLINNHSSNNRDLEFKNEVLLLAKLSHRNLVRLLGFSMEKNERILVYEFMPNSSLDHFLFDSDKRTHLDWNRRYMIIAGIARGLLYLHEESSLKIIHRDLKAGNVLLDAEMNPKIADFGTARLFANLDQTRDKTKRIAGTYGYMAPEYANIGEYSVKSDVFSFGVLFLEIICGQRVKDFHDGEKVESLLTYAWKSFKEGRAMSLVDPKMRAASKSQIIRCIHIGLLCVQEKAINRPTMSSVLLMLSSSSFSLQRPSRPAYFVPSNSQSGLVRNSNRSMNNPAQVSEKRDSLITELFPR